MEYFENGDKIKRLPCLHFFHTKEIESWVINHRQKVCPICRHDITKTEF